MSANVMDETQNDLDQRQFLVVSEEDERNMRQLIEDIGRNSRPDIRQTRKCMRYYTCVRHISACASIL